MVHKEKKNMIALLVGKWTSKIGNVVFDYVNNIVLVSLNSKTSMLVAIYQSSETIIQVAVNILAGVFADKINKKKLVLISTDFISVLICFLLSFFLHDKFTAYIIIFANCLLALVETINSPLYKTIVRETVRKENISKLNSIANAGYEGLALIGPIVGIFLVKFLDVRFCLVFNGITFIISALIESLIVIDSNCEDKQLNENVWNGIKKGIRYLYSDKKLLITILCAGCINFFIAGSNIFIPYSNLIWNNKMNNLYATILVMQGVSAILGSLISVYLSRFFQLHKKIILFLPFFIGFSYLLIPVMANISVGFLFILPFSFAGFFMTIYNIQYMSYIQENVALEYIGRVFGVIKTFSLILVPIGAFIFSHFFGINGQIGFPFAGLGIVIISI